MHNIATIYQHQLNKFESLTLVSMRAVYPEDFHPIGSVQKKWQAFFSSHEENFGVDLATKKNNTCVPYILHIFYQILGNPPFFAIQLRFFGLNRLENPKWPICG